MNSFIKLKHWQLFSLQFGLTFVIAIVDDPGPTQIKLASNFVLYGVYFFWIWSVAKFLSRLLHQDNKLLSAVILITFSCFFITDIYYVINFSQTFQLPVIVSLTFFALLLYLVIKVGRLLRIAEANSQMDYSNFLLYSFLLLVFPIGMWLIQPKLNKLAEQGNDPPNSNTV